MREDPPKLSARNRLPGYVTAIKTDGIMAQVELQVGDNHIVAVITAEAVADMGLRVGMEAVALIKSTSVMILTREGDIAGL
jgi:molybdopterin-binding protein